MDYFFDQSEQSYFIVYSCFSNLIHISDVLNTRKVNFEGHNQLVSSLISLKGFRKIEYYIASGDENGNALIWRTDSRETLYSFSNLHIGWITSISLFSWLNGDFIVTGSSDHTIKILDLNLGDYIKEFRFKKYEISFVAVGGGIENDLSLIFGNFSNIFYLYTWFMFLNYNFFNFGNSYWLKWFISLIIEVLIILDTPAILCISFILDNGRFASN